MAIAVLSLTGTTSSGTASTFTITAPTGLVDGAVLYLNIATNNNSTTWVVAKNTDATWVRLGDGEDNATVNVGQTIFRRVVTTASSEPSSYAFSNVTQSDDTTTNSVGFGWCLIGLSGVDNTTPEDVVLPAFTQNASSANTVCTATSTVSDNAWIVAMAVSDQTTTAVWSAPATYANLTSINTGRAAALATKGPITPAGSVASATFGNTGGAPGVGNQVSVRPATTTTTALMPQGRSSGMSG